MNLRGKRVAVFGVANHASIAWGITKAIMARGGAPVLCVHPMMRERAAKLADENGIIEPLIVCDVERAPGGEAIDLWNAFQGIAEGGPIYGVVHSIGFSDKEELEGPFINTSRENFLRTMNVSCYSFVEMCRLARPLMKDGGSLLTLTFDASRGSYPNYNVMALAKAALETAVVYGATDLGEFNIRVNAIAASPENTLAARGISNFRAIGAFAEAQSPLGRRATVEEIANTAAFLLSPESSGITGQTIFVDCGSSITTMPPARNAIPMANAMNTVAEIYAKRRNQTAHDEHAEN
jgi:enoyl-[acyl-carrier protein] reductase I